MELNFVIICALIVTVTVHELGHAIVAKKYGVKIRNISLFGLGPLLVSWKSSFFNGARIGIAPIPYGAYVSFDEDSFERLSRKALDDISFAGPHMNFVTCALAGILYVFFFEVSRPLFIATVLSALLMFRPVKLIFLYGILPFVSLHFIWFMLTPDSMSVAIDKGFVTNIVSNNFFDTNNFVRNFLYNLVVINLILGIGNMLPIFPLDGGHIAKRMIEKHLSEKHIIHTLLFVCLPLVLLFVLILPIIGDIRKIFTFFF